MNVDEKVISIHDLLSMDIIPSREDIMWLLEQAEDLQDVKEKYESLKNKYDLLYQSNVPGNQKTLELSEEIERMKNRVGEAIEIIEESRRVYSKISKVMESLRD